MTTQLLNDAITSREASTQPLSKNQRLEKVLEQLPSLQGQENAKPVQFEALVEPVKKINTVMRPYGLEFELGSKSTGVVTKVVDLETGKVIRQTPSEEVLRIAERLEEVAGLLIQQQA